MNENIYKHLIQLSLSFPVASERLFDLLSDGRAKAETVADGNLRKVIITIGDKTYTNTQNISLDSCLDEEKREIICASRAFYMAAGEACGFYPEWGIIDGVKPVRLYLNLLQKGMDAPDIIRKNYLISPAKASLVDSIGDFEYDVSKSLPQNSYNLYISIPFCPTRCRYCSFICADTSMSRLIPDYIDALCEEIKNTAQIMRDMTLNTVYIGGGTPTTLDEKQLEKLLWAVKSEFSPNGLEFTLEAGRPDTVNADKLEIAKKYGVNRVSINTQTTNDEVLVAVGRRHTAEDYFKAFALARKVGFDVINTDLIAGFENDTFKKSIQDVAALSPENLTVHTLCVKNSATLREEGFVRKGEDTAHLLEYAQNICHNNGYFPYYLYKQKNALSGLENIGYAKKGCECIYNICMMSEFNSTVALGAGGATKMVYPLRTLDRTEGFFDCKYPKEYIENPEKTKRKYDFLKKYIQDIK